MRMRNWRILVVGGLSAALGVVALAATSTHQVAASSSRHRHHAHGAVLLGCGDLVGTTQWSGTYDTYSGTGVPIHGSWTGNWTVAPDGTVSGSINPSGPVTGDLSCGTIDLSLGGAGNGALGTYALNGQTATGSGTFVYDGYSGSWSGSTTSFQPSLSLTPSTLPIQSGPVTYTATLSGGSPGASGEVDISDNLGASCAINSLVDGVGSCDLTEQASDGPYTVTASYLGDSNDTPASTALTNTSAVATGGSISTGSTQVQATAQGGTPGVDTLSETQYGTNPVGNLNDGSNYFDVAASSGNAFSDVVIQDCNNVTATSILSWWDPTANSGTGGWSPVIGDPGPTYDPVAGCLSATLDATTVPTISQLTGTVFATSIPTQAITSAGGATATAGTPFSLTVTTTGGPTPSLSESGSLPAGLQFQDNLDGTATLSGTPTGATAGGVYDPTFTATFGSGGDENTVSQTLTLFVLAAPTFSSPASTSVGVGNALNFVATAPGYPPSVITETGSLPSGVTFQTVRNGTAVLSGTPASGTGGSYRITLTASNGVGSPARQIFTLTVIAVPSISSFSPTSGPVGTTVTIKGANLNGATKVTFNGVKGTIASDNATKLKVRVPSGATTGKIKVVTAGGTAKTATSFRVT